jgi:hypothetical protein
MGIKWSMVGSEYVSIGDGVKAILVDGVPHAVGKPAVITMDDGGEAIMWEYFVDGQLSRTDGPARVFIVPKAGGYYRMHYVRSPGQEDEWWVENERAGKTLRKRIFGLVTSGTQAEKDASRYFFSDDDDATFRYRVLEETVGHGSGKYVTVFDKDGELAMEMHIKSEGFGGDRLHCDDGPAVVYHGYTSFVTSEWWTIGSHVKGMTAARRRHTRTLVNDLVAQRDGAGAGRTVKAARADA